MLQHSMYLIYTSKLRRKVFTNNRRMWSKQENIGDFVIHDAVVMGNVCHACVNDVGM